MSDVRIIKRYQNRKLYDTHQSCYVTLEEIAQIIREGNEIQVIDNKTKNDRVRKKQGLGKGCHPSELRQDFMLCSNDPEYMMKKVEYCYNHGLMEIRQ